MARIMNSGLWHKAYMLEFQSSAAIKTGFFGNGSNSDSEIFTFALPPESEDFDYKQRVTETKTFGGAVFDDYGNDTYRIVLSGTTVNNEKKLIYKGTKTLPGYLTGEQEIFKLQEMIDKYGQLDHLEDKKVYLYDLSKMTLLEIAASSPTARSWWRVHINSLKIRRSKDKPFTYNYTLEMTAYKDDEKPNGISLFSEGFQNFVSGMRNAVDKINAVVSTAEMAVATVGSIREKCTEYSNLMEQYRNGDTSSKLSILNGIVGKTERLLIGTSITNAAYTAGKEILVDCDRLGIISRAKEENDDSKSGSISEDEKFTITFNANGGYFVDETTREETEEYKEEVSYSENATVPKNPVRENYEFDYWYQGSDSGTEFNFKDTPIKSNMILSAKWVQKRAVVSFNSLGGSDVEPQTVEIGKTAEKPSKNPTRSGYLFNQWCSNRAATTAFDFTTPINADTTLYAAWTHITAVTVTFESNGGSTVESQNVEPGSRVLYPVTPTKENYVFAGWFTDADLTNSFDFSQEITQSSTLYAKWTHVYCDVLFDAKGGSPIEAQKVLIGGTAEKPENPQKDGYGFAFWCKDSAATNEFSFATKILADMTLFARWILNVYEVKFQTNGGSSVASQNVSHGNLAQFPVIPEKDGYSFVMWCSDKYLNTEFDFSTPITNAKTLYARWFGSSYTFSFESNGGTEFEPQTVEHGKTAQEKRPAKEGHTFDGWFIDEDFSSEFDFATPIEHDTTIYAKWTAEKRTVTFESNGGSDIEAQTVDYGNKAAKPMNPEKSGSTFDGWYSDNGLSQKYDFDTPVTADITLYAKWS